MVTNRWSGRFRIYWNSKDEAPLWWSIDQGDVSPKVKVTTVTIQCAVRTHIWMGADNTEEPRGWLEGIGEVRVYDNGAALIMGTGLHIDTGAFDRLTDGRLSPFASKTVALGGT